jgi:integrase
MADVRFSFSKERLATLPSPASGSRDTYHDTKAKGLQLRVTAAGVKTFSVYRRMKAGKPERVTLGRFPEMTVEQARRLTASINAKIEEGANPADAKRAHKAELTFGNLFDTWVERHAKPSNRGWDKDVRRYRQYLEKPLGGKKLSMIRRDTVATLHSGITMAGRPAVANRVLAIVSSVFGRGIEWGLVEHNPAKGIRRNREISRDRFLQAEELPRFFAALAEEPNEAVRDYILMSLLTGARRANVQSMRWADISLTEAVWRIPVTKNGTPQNVTLPPAAITILHARKLAAEPAVPFVFPGSGKDGHLHSPRKGFLRVTRKAGIENLRIHDLRRTLGSWQAKTGASLIIIGKSLNHRSPQTTAIYARLDLDPVRHSVDRATAAIFAAAGLKPTADIINLRPGSNSPFFSTKRRTA